MVNNFDKYTIQLSKVMLINWYGFENVTIPFAMMTFFAGENQQGKSTILDAIKYGLFGDSNFNTGANGKKSHRTILSYTRGMINEERGLYIRDENTYRDVITHIAFEFYETDKDSYFVLDTLITTHLKETTPHRFIFNDMKLSDIEFINENKCPIDNREIEDKYELRDYSGRQGVLNFLQRYGVYVTEQSLNVYLNRIRNLTYYTQTNDISEFCRRYILDEQNVNLKKVKTSLEKANKAKNEFEKVKTKQDLLYKISNLFDEYYDLTEKYMTQIMLRNFLDYSKKYDESKDLEAEIEKLEISTTESTLKKDKLSIEIESISQELITLKSQLFSLRPIEEINSLDHRKSLLETELNTLKKDIIQLKEMFFKVSKLIEENYMDICTVLDPNEIEVTADVEKLSDQSMNNRYALLIDKLLKYYSDVNEKLSDEKLSLSVDMRNLKDEIAQLDEDIEQLNQNRIPSSYLKDQERFIHDVNLKFEELGINSEAKYACEYVENVEDEKWRDALETYLSRSKYSIIVPSKHFDIADEILNSGHYKFVRLVNTPRLIAKNKDIVRLNDGLHKKLKIGFYEARLYFEYLLGHIHACDKSSVKKFDSALSCEGKLSSNMSVSFLDFKKMNSYVLGIGSSELEKNRKMSERSVLIDKYGTIYNNISHLDIDLRRIENIKKFSDHSDFETFVNYENTKIKISEITDEINVLNEAFKNNEEYKAIENLCETRNHDLAILREKDKEYTEIISENKAAVEEKNKTLDSLNEWLKNSQYRTDVAAGKMHEYDLIKEQYENGILKLISKKESDEINTKLNGDNGIVRNLIHEQDIYNDFIKSFSPDDVVTAGVDETRRMQFKDKLLSVHNSEIHRFGDVYESELSAFERSLKEEFILRIYENCLQALSSINEINREIRNLKFDETYEFSVQMLKDSSEFGTFIRYGEYLKRSNELFYDDEVYSYDQDEIDELEIKVNTIISKILGQNSDKYLDRFSDYRNYMKYDIKFSNKLVPKGSLKNEIKYLSGGGNQIPYIIILTGALSLFYRKNPNCCPLVFLDEAFEKLSDENIIPMLNFFEQQNLQVSLFAPTNKMPSIGKASKCVVPVIKTVLNNTVRMDIGVVRFE